MWVVVGQLLGMKKLLHYAELTKGVLGQLLALLMKLLLSQGCETWSVFL